jgi:hypothetical protein
MKNRTSIRRGSRPMNDFQIFKGFSDSEMKPFGAPVMAHHEAQLLIRDDQAAGSMATYAIYKRSENRILQIFRTPEEAEACLPLAA